MRASRNGFLQFATPAGVIVLAALDSTLFFAMPLGIDAVVVASERSAGSCRCSQPAAPWGRAALTFWMGRKIGDKGLQR